MKFECDSATFKQAISTVEKAISQKTTMPSLENIYMELIDQGLKMRGNDLELGIEYTTPIDTIHQPGRVLIKAKTISNIMAKLGQEKLSFSVNESHQIALKAGAVDFELLGLSTDEYPVFPNVESGLRLSLSVETLKALIKDTIFSVSMDETKPFLNGILVKIEEQNIVFVATDGYRLAIRKEIFSQSNDAFQVIIPQKAMNELYKIIQNKDNNEQVVINITPTQVAFQMNQLLLLSRVIQGQFPDYTKVLPAQAEQHCTINRRQLLAACERAAIIASMANNVVKMVFGPSVISLKAQAPGTGEFAEDVPYNIIQANTETVGVAFNVKLILEALRTIESDDVDVTFNSELSPTVIKPVSDSDFTYIVMPIRMSDVEVPKPAAAAAVPG